MTQNKKPIKKYRKQLRWFWGLFYLGLGGFIAIFAAASLGLLGDMPEFRQLENPKTNLATQIISSDDVVLGKFYFNDNRTPLGYEEIPQNLIDALIATLADQRKCLG